MKVPLLTETKQDSIVKEGRREREETKRGEREGRAPGRREGEGRALGRREGQKWGGLSSRYFQ